MCIPWTASGLLSCSSKPGPAAAYCCCLLLLLLPAAAAAAAAAGLVEFYRHVYVSHQQGSEWGDLLFKGLRSDGQVQQVCYCVLARCSRYDTGVMFVGHLCDICSRGCGLKARCSRYATCVISV
jgi:hypothetical protein